MKIFNNLYFYALVVASGFSLVAIFNKSAGTPVSQSALFSGARVLMVIKLLDKKGIKGGLRNWAILIVSVIATAVIGAVLAELLNIR